VNVFFLDRDPKLAAQYHCDSHVVKMITETYQMMEIAVVLLNNKKAKLAYQNHPCSIWIRESRDNFAWAYDLAFWLNFEWRYRYGHPKYKHHQSFLKINERILARDLLPDKGLTEPALAMPDEYKSKDPVESYRAYYKHDKAHLLHYRRRNKPYWLED